MSSRAPPIPPNPCHWTCNDLTKLSHTCVRALCCPFLRVCAIDLNVQIRDRLLPGPNAPREVSGPRGHPFGRAAGAGLPWRLGGPSERHAAPVLRMGRAAQAARRLHVRQASPTFIPAPAPVPTRVTAAFAVEVVGTAE